MDLLHLYALLRHREELKRGGKKKVKRQKKKKEEKKKEKRRKERKHVSPLGRHGHPLKELRNLSRLECKPRRQVCLQRIYCDGSLLFHAGFTRYRRERMREMVRSLCKRNAQFPLLLRPFFLILCVFNVLYFAPLEVFSTAFSAVQPLVSLIFLKAVNQAPRYPLEGERSNFPRIQAVIAKLLPVIRPFSKLSLQNLEMV